MQSSALRHHNIRPAACFCLYRTLNLFSHIHMHKLYCKPHASYSSSFITYLEVKVAREGLVTLELPMKVSNTDSEARVAPSGTTPPVRSFE